MNIWIMKFVIFFLFLWLPVFCPLYNSSISWIGERRWSSYITSLYSLNCNELYWEQNKKLLSDFFFFFFWCAFTYINLFSVLGTLVREVWQITLFCSCGNQHTRIFVFVNAAIISTDNLKLVVFKIKINVDTSGIWYFKIFFKILLCSFLHATCSFMSVLWKY